MSAQRWTTEKNIQFIETYKQHECLWNPRHVEYKHKKVRYMAYEEIRKAMGMDSVKEVITRIRILRNTQNSVMTKAKKNEHYVSKISWLPHLDFIRDIVRVAQRGKDGSQDLHRSDTVSSEEDSRSSLVQESYRRNGNRIYNAEILMELSQRWTAETRAPTTQEETQGSYHSDSGSSEESSLIDPPDEKRIKLEDPLDQESEESYFQEKESNLIDPSVEKRNQIENPLVQESEESHLQEMVSLPSSRDNDEFGLFGQTVAEQLRQLPLEVALETEEMILSTIRSQRIKILASTSSQIIVKQELD